VRHIHIAFDKSHEMKGVYCPNPTKSAKGFLMTKNIRVSDSGGCLDDNDNRTQAAALSMKIRLGSIEPGPALPDDGDFWYLASFNFQILLYFRPLCPQAGLAN
jgi:hypothetical protein